MNLKFENIWDRIAFIGSITGLIFLIVISFIRYYYIIPAQKEASKDFKYIQQLKNKNKSLEAEIIKLKKAMKYEKK